MTAGVYAIFNTANGFVYIGSSVNIERRWSGRIWEFNRGQAANKRLQADWTASRGQGFAFRVLETTASDNKALLTAEEEWIACLRAVSPGIYNQREASVGRHGFPMTRQGWGWVVDKRKAHYFPSKGQTSLCGKAERYKASDLVNDLHDSPDNCAACRVAYVQKRRTRARRAAEGE